MSDESLPQCSVIIPAAGESTRMGGDVRKPFMELCGEPIIYRTCRKIREIPGVEEVILVLNPGDMEYAMDEIWDELMDNGVSLVVAGGANRAESVWCGVEVMSATSELVAIHDAVRPFVSADICKQLFKIAAVHGAAVPIVPLSDTVKRVEGDLITETPRRLGMVRVQTPQVFQSDLFIDANEYVQSTGGYSEAITDDASIVEVFGSEVRIVLGEEYNLKITTPRDLKIAEALLKGGVV